MIRPLAHLPVMPWWWRGPVGLKVIIAVLALWAAEARGGNFSALRSSVYKIHVTASEPNFTEPWKKASTNASTGTGFYIGNHRILTNAHVVANAAYITVLRDGDSRPIPARVRFIAHDCDLALLEPVSNRAVDGVTPLSFGPLPKLRSPVSTIGYPMGGDQLSITDGIVSRVSYRRYVHHGSAKHLLVQVDSAINPGNSGGPVVQGRVVVGVAFQTYTQAENTGYIIPTPVIRRFLRDVENNNYEGHPDDGLTANEWTMANPSAAAFHGLTGDVGGIKINHVAAWAPTAGLILPGDIILELDDQPIGVDGKVNFEGERVDFRTLFDLKLMGDRAKFKISRDGAISTVVVPVKPSAPHHSPENIYARHPRYFVWGGLVFTSLSRSLLRTWGERWYKDAPLLLRYLDSNDRFDPDFAQAPEIIVLTRRLPDAVNAYATSNMYGVLRTVGERRIGTLEDLIQALEGSADPFVVLHFFGGDEPIVLARQPVLERNAAINSKYGVASDRWLKGAEDDAAISGVEAGTP